MQNLDAFLKPESMTTPGAAGALAMMITNSLYYQFDLEPRIVCLILSFILGTIVFRSAGTLLKRSGFYVINSLLIFTFATGSNSIGVTATTDTPEGAPARDLTWQFSFVPRAIAAEAPSALKGAVQLQTLSAVNAQILATLPREDQAKCKELLQLQAQKLAAIDRPHPEPAQAEARQPTPAAVPPAPPAAKPGIEARAPATPALPAPSQKTKSFFRAW